MKKIALIGVLLLIGFTLNAAELSPTAQAIRNVNPDAYGVIKERAEAEWGTDYTMVLYVINQQCEAALEFLNIAKLHSQEALDALCEWTDGGTAEVDRVLASGASLLTTPADWTMVVYVANQQIDAKGKY